MKVKIKIPICSFSPNRKTLDLVNPTLVLSEVEKSRKELGTKGRIFCRNYANRLIEIESRPVNAY